MEGPGKPCTDTSWKMHREKHSSAPKKEEPAPRFQIRNFLENSNEMYCNRMSTLVTNECLITTDGVLKPKLSKQKNKSSVYH